MTTDVVLALMWLLFHFLGWYVINQYTSRKQHRLFAFKTIFDDQLPFLPVSIIGYLSGDLLVLLPLVYLASKSTFTPFIGVYFAVSAGAFAVYLLLPTQVEWIKPQAVKSRIMRTVYEMWQRLARPHNTIPSLHVALPVVASCCISVVNPSLGFLCFGWSAVVGISSLLSKQHYIVDLGIGFVFGLVLFFLVYTFAGII